MSRIVFYPNFQSQESGIITPCNAGVYTTLLTTIFDVQWLFLIGQSAAINCRPVLYTGAGGSEVKLISSITWPVNIPAGTTLFNLPTFVTTGERISINPTVAMANVSLVVYGP